MQEVFKAIFKNYTEQRIIKVVIEEWHIMMDCKKPVALYFGSEIHVLLEFFLQMGKDRAEIMHVSNPLYLVISSSVENNDDQFNLCLLSLFLYPEIKF